MDSTDRPSYEPEPAPPEPPEAEAPPAKLSPFQRLIAAFYAPGEVFADIARKPSWVAALVLLVLVSFAAQMLVIPHVDMEATMLDRMERSGQPLSEAEMDAMLERVDTFKYIGPVVGIVFLPIVMLIITAVLLVTVRLVGGETGFEPAFSAILHGFWPASLVKSALLVLLTLRVDKLPAPEIQGLLKSNLGAFLAEDAPAWLGAVASSLDIFTIWIVILLVVGLSIIGRVSRGKAAVAVIVPWIVVVVVKALFAVLFGGMA